MKSNEFLKEMDTAYDVNGSKYAAKKMRLCVFSINYDEDANGDVFIKYIAIEKPDLDLNCKMTCKSVLDFAHINKSMSIDEFKEYINELYAHFEKDLKYAMKQLKALCLAKMDQLNAYVKAIEKDELVEDVFKP